MAKTNLSGFEKSRLFEKKSCLRGGGPKSKYPPRVIEPHMEGRGSQKCALIAMSDAHVYMLSDSPVDVVRYDPSNRPRCILRSVHFFFVGERRVTKPLGLVTRSGVVRKSQPVT